MKQDEASRGSRLLDTEVANNYFDFPLHSTRVTSLFSSYLPRYFPVFLKRLLQIFKVSITLAKRSKGQLFYPLRWLIYIFNSVVNTKLPAIPSHRRSTTVSLETYPFLQHVSRHVIPPVSLFKRGQMFLSRHSVPHHGWLPWTYSKNCSAWILNSCLKIVSTHRAHF